jgi:hypothetical protein
MNFASGAVPLVPVAPGAAEPAVPVGFGFAALAVSPGIGGAAFRQPVTTIFLSELDGALCGGAGACAGVCAGVCEGACARMPAVARLIIAAHVPVQTLRFIIPPMNAKRLQQSDR